MLKGNSSIRDGDFSSITPSTSSTTRMDASVLLCLSFLPIAPALASMGPCQPHAGLCAGRTQAPLVCSLVSFQRFPSLHSASGRRHLPTEPHKPVGAATEQRQHCSEWAGAAPSPAAPRTCSSSPLSPPACAQSSTKPDRAQGQTLHHFPPPPSLISGNDSRAQGYLGFPSTQARVDKVSGKPCGVRGASPHQALHPQTCW